MKPALLIAAFTLLAPSAALADEAALTRAFTAICMPSATPGAALAAAKSQGFVTPPPQALDKFKIPDLPKARMLWKTGEGVLTMVMAGDGPIASMGGVQANICAVIDMPAIADPEAAMRSLLRVGPAQGATGQKVFLYEEDRSSRRAISQTDGATAMRTISEGTMRMAMGVNRDGTSMMMLIAPKAP